MTEASVALRANPLGTNKDGAAVGDEPRTAPPSG